MLLGWDGHGVDIHKILVGVSMQRIPKSGHGQRSLHMRYWKLPKNTKSILSLWAGEGETEIDPELGSVAQAVVRKAKCTVLVGEIIYTISLYQIPASNVTGYRLFRMLKI